MKDFNNVLFGETIKQIKSSKKIIINVNALEESAAYLKYFLTNNFYYAVVVDDYPFEIVDKNSLLEALYYQVRLITMHDLNWDAFEEAMEDALNIFSEFEGICLIFRRGKKIKDKLPKELKLLFDIIENINSRNDLKKVKLLGIE